MITFEKALAEFGKKLFRKGFSIGTIKWYIEQTKRVFNSCWKIENWQSITANEIENWIYSNKKLSNWTKNAYSVQIRAFLRFCRILDLKTLNPEKIAVQKYHVREARYLSENEEKKVLSYLNKEWTNQNMKACILLMLSTGLRVSEACNLSKKKFRNAYFIEWMYQIPIQWKWGTVRPIFIPPKIYKHLEKFSNRHSERTIIPVKNNQIQKLIKKFSKKIEINFTAHTFRHTYCTKLAQKGVEIHKIQKLAGHTCIITTSRYLHTSNIELAKISWLIANINY